MAIGIAGRLPRVHEVPRRKASLFMPSATNFGCKHVRGGRNERRECASGPFRVTWRLGRNGVC